MLTLVHAKPDDTYAIAELLEELDRFYGGTDFALLEDRAKEVQAMIFREQPAAYVLLAKEGEQVIGMAAYSYLWPAVGLTQSLYLKELYVTEPHRRRGVGKLLIDKILAIAAENDCSRVEWTADRNNPLALGFYARLGHSESLGKALYRVQVDEER